MTDLPAQPPSGDAPTHEVLTEHGIRTVPSGDARDEGYPTTEDVNEAYTNGLREALDVERRLSWVILNGGLQLPGFAHMRQRTTSKPSDPDDIRWDCSCGYSAGPETVRNHWRAMNPALATPAPQPLSPRPEVSPMIAPARCAFCRGDHSYRDHFDITGECDGVFPGAKCGAQFWHDRHDPSVPPPPPPAPARCPVCGTPGRIVGGDEGTQHFETAQPPSGDALREALVTERDRLRDILDRVPPTVERLQYPNPTAREDAYNKGVRDLAEAIARAYAEQDAEVKP